MSSRDAIFASLRQNRPPGEHPLPDLRLFEVAHAGDLVAFFETNLKAMGGKVFGAPASADLGGVVAQLYPDAKMVASATPEIRGNRNLGAVAHPRDLADVDVAVVRAAFAIAETGSVLLSDDALAVNSLAYLAQHLLVLLDPADIVASTQEAYRRPEMRAHHYAVFHTGPSATADIEGVLIHGAQGVRSLTVIMRPRGLSSDPERGGATAAAF